METAGSAGDRELSPKSLYNEIMMTIGGPHPLDWTYDVGRTPAGASGIEHGVFTDTVDLVRVIQVPVITALRS